MHVSRGGSAAVVLGLLLLACGEAAAPYEPATEGDATALFWALTIDHRAVTLSTVAPYDTIRITATPRDAAGHALAGLGPVTYRSTDPERVRITEDGLMSAVEAGNGVRVVAELKAGNAHHVDTLVVNVTDDAAPPELASLSIQPEPPDSARWAVDGDGQVFLRRDGSYLAVSAKFITARLADAGGNPLGPEVAVVYTTSDTMIARIYEGGILLAKRPGTVKVYASATAYGVMRADTLAVTITNPVFGVVPIRPAPVAGAGTVFAATEVVIPAGGTVLWTNVTGQPVDVVFDDPTNVAEHGAPNCAPFTEDDAGGAGDIAAFGEPLDPDFALLTAANCRSRSFPVAGVYPYRSTITGAHGRVVVTAESTVP